MDDSFFFANRELWNTRTELHVESDFYNVAAFKKGASSLTGIELQEMGDVSGKSILHLQCHFGLDTLSLSRLGAQVTGVDFSDTAIATAKSLADELDLAAEFVCCNVLDLQEHLDRQFDIVFTSFGVLGWLPDLAKWANVIHRFLKPQGFLYLLEFHPYFVQFNDEGNVAYDYFFSEQPDQEFVTTTYADETEHAPHTEFWWNHTISDVFTAVCSAGLQVEFFHEFPYSAYKTTNEMVQTKPGNWVHSRLQGKIPYMFSLRANKTT